MDLLSALITPNNVSAVVTGIGALAVSIFTLRLAIRKEAEKEAKSLISMLQVRVKTLEEQIDGLNDHIDDLELDLRQVTFARDTLTRENVELNRRLAQRFNQR